MKRTRKALVVKCNPTPLEIERQRRIRVSVAAYSYEYYNDSIMSDEEFDALCLKIDKNMSTNNEKLDKFFREEFEPHTGMWIRKHPEKEGLDRIYWQVFRKNETRKTVPRAPKKKVDMQENSMYTWHKSIEEGL